MGGRSGKHSPLSLHPHAQDLPRLTFRNHLKRPAAHLAIRRKPLRWGARVDDQVEALAAIGALTGLADFHILLY